MPFKTKKKRREYMKKYREKQKRQLQELKIKFPDVYQLIFGKKRKKVKRR